MARSLALKSWKRQITAKGEIFDAKRIWPPPSARGRKFSNQLAQAIRGLPPRLANYAGLLSGIMPVQPGQGRRGSQEPTPPMAQTGAATNTREDLDALISQAQPALESLRQLMKDPPPGMGYDIIKFWRRPGPQICQRSPSSPRSLQAATMNDLHQGDLAGAMRNLGRLFPVREAVCRGPHSGHIMSRMAIVGLSVDVCWDALQANGWTEPQPAASSKRARTTKGSPRKCHGPWRPTEQLASTT